MTDKTMLEALGEVEQLSSAATDGEWVTTLGGDVKQHLGLQVFRRNDLRGDQAYINAAYVAHLSNFLRTHADEIRHNARRLKALEQAMDDFYQRFLTPSDPVQWLEDRADEIMRGGE